jgi:hypothetical protein
MRTLLGRRQFPNFSRVKGAEPPPVRPEDGKRGLAVVVVNASHPSDRSDVPRAGYASRAVTWGSSGPLAEGTRARSAQAVRSALAKR